MRRRTRLTILGVLLVAAVLTFVVLLRTKAPPEPARLLPGADAFVYVNLKWVRRINHLDQIPPVPYDAQYEQFIRETGFQFERDLDEAAFAVHYTGPLSARDGSPRYTEILDGRWNSERVAAYLRKIARGVEVYRQVQIFTVPVEDHNLRIAMIGVGEVAMSNTDDPQIIRDIIDRSRKLASPFGGPALLRAHYKHVPFGSLAWAIVGNPAQLQNTRLNSLLGPLDYRRLLQDSVVVISLRFLRAIHIRVEAFFEDRSQAAEVSEKMGTLLTLFHDLQPTLSSGGTDQDVKQFFDSLKVEQHGERVRLSANVPLQFVRKLFTEPPPEAAPVPVAPAPQPALKPKPKRKAHR